MKILIAPDSYKECLSAMRVAECIAKGLQASIPDAEVILRPMADGGEGTVDALI
ncbi:glycerate kinase [Macrococcus bohemicus]|nr:glycerate kinase [Macrococcus bohemicus]